MSLPPQEIDWLALDLDPRGLRIGVQIEAGIGLPLSDDVRRAVSDAAARFAAAGAIVEEVSPCLTREMLDGLDDFWRQRAWADIGALAPRERDRVLPYIVAWAKGGETLSGERVYRGMSQMQAIQDASLKQIAPFDLIISPVSPVPSFPAHLASPIDDPARPFEHIVFTVAANMSDQPSVAVPAAMTASGLPIGIQITGRRFDDLGVLRAARLWERLKAPLPDWPRPA